MEGEVHHSPRLTELDRLRAEHENEQQRHREVQLLKNRTLVKEKRDSMSKQEKDALLEKHRNDYRLRTLKRGQGNNNGDKAETSSAHELILAANQFIPRRSPRFLDQKQQQEAVSADNDANKKLEMDMKQIEIQLQERRIRYHIRKNLLTKAEKEKIREYKCITYLKRRSTTASEGSSDQVVGMNIGTLIERAKKRQSEIDEELTAIENKRSKKCRHENQPRTERTWIAGMTCFGQSKKKFNERKLNRNNP